MARKKRAASSDSQSQASAEGGRINKSQAVRDYMADHPRAKPKQIAEELTQKHGIEFTPGAVSTIRHQMKKSKGRKGRPGRRPKAAAGAMKVNIDDLVAAKKMAERLGGVEKTRQILNVLAQLG
jgi:hypothetical protein